ncbi:rod shape-determining protein RodA [Planctomycetota bacterium]|nr:rod shape-determining protein RodA [Planctomycetota bacterium]
MRIRKQMKDKVSLLKAMPLGVVIPALLMCATGVLFIYSASSDFELMSEGLSGASGYHTRQIAYATLGFLLMLGVALMPQRWLSQYWLLWLALGVTMLGAVLVFGRTINGAKSWIALGPVNLQPSELCKPLIVIALAGYLRYHQSVDTFRTFFLSLVIAGMFLVPIMMQPDLGTTMVFIPVLGAMIYVAGGNRLYLLGMGFCGLTVIPAAYVLGVLKPHQMKRIEIYLSSLGGEVADRTGDGYHILQSMVAIGSGGVWGKGFGQGSQSQLSFLPERHTDFIFSVVAEEAGLVGVAVFILILFWMLTRMLGVASNAKEPFARLIVVGVCTMFFAQAAINIGVVSGVVPVTGITLPLVSYGGSSLLSAFISIGLVCNVAVQPQRVMGRATF